MEGEGEERVRERRDGDPLTVMQLSRGNLTAISCHTRKPRVAGKIEDGAGRGSRERGQGEGAGTGYRGEADGNEKGEQGGRRGRRQRREEFKDNE